MCLVELRLTQEASVARADGKGQGERCRVSSHRK